MHKSEKKGSYENDCSVKSSKLRQESFGISGRESERKRSCEDAPDQDTADEELNVSKSSPGSDVDISNVNLVSDPSDDVSKVVI